MTRRAFWIGGWVALVVGTLAAVAAAAVVVIGVLALAGRVTYPVDFGLGPFSIHNEVSIPVGFGGDVCQSASVREQEATSDCLKFFVHEENWLSEGAVRVQDADIRPISAELTGTVDLATTGGWSGFVAASIARNAIGLTVISAVLLLLWRLLANSAAGAVFSPRAVKYVRGIGWLLIVGSVAEAALSLFTSAIQLGYSFEMFGTGPHLELMSNGGINFVQLALGGLILLLAEVFRHGAAVEAEQKLTV